MRTRAAGAIHSKNDKPQERPRTSRAGHLRHARVARERAAPADLHRRAGLRHRHRRRRRQPLDRHLPPRGGLRPRPRGHLGDPRPPRPGLRARLHSLRRPTPSRAGQNPRRRDRVRAPRSGRPRPHGTRPRDGSAATRVARARARGPAQPAGNRVLGDRTALLHGDGVPRPQPRSARRGRPPGHDPAVPVEPLGGRPGGRIPVAFPLRPHSRRHSGTQPVRQARLGRRYRRVDQRARG